MPGRNRSTRQQPALDAARYRGSRGDCRKRRDGCQGICKTPVAEADEKAAGCEEKIIRRQGIVWRESRRHSPTNKVIIKHFGV
jgi:hypothetical protein